MTVGLNTTIHIWWDEVEDQIKMRVGGELTSVNGRPESKRGNPSLFKKLSKVLEDEGKPFPRYYKTL